MQHPTVLVLNETRKTLLASRLHWARPGRVHHELRGRKILPGDGIWLEACDQVHTTGMAAPLDLLFLDADHRVVEKISHLPPGSSSPRVPVACGVLELPAGTIRSTQTEIGDRILIEAIVAERSPS
jgi:hypothetical protein